MNSVKEALFKEISLLKAYENFQNDEFEAIKETRKKAIKLLNSIVNEDNIEYEEKNNIKCASIEDLISSEKELCSFYNTLCENEHDDKIRDLFFRLWATSNNEYIPFLLSKNSKQKDECSFSIFTKDMQEFLQNAKLIADGNLNPKLISQTINNKHFGLFLGIGVGGFAAIVINEILKKDK